MMRHYPMPVGALLIAGTSLLIACAGGTRGLHAQNAGAPASMQTIAMRRLRHSLDSRIDSPLRIVISDSADLVQVWNDAWGSPDHRPVPPSVDFSRHRVIVAASGRRPMLGTDLTITSVTSIDGILRVGVTIARVAPGCLVGQVEVSPIDIVEIPKPWPGLVVMFVDTVATDPCE